MEKELLIIFVKTVREGEVKTRLADSVGTKKALSIYKKLLDRTHETTIGLQQKKWVAYSGSITRDDLWENELFGKIQQRGQDLGQKMCNAFQDGFSNSYKHICLIGSDIFDLTDKIIEQAFVLLEHHDIVLGPATDGGYYLIGLKKLHLELFENMPWSTQEVLHQSTDVAQKLGLKIGLLPPLNDIDTLDDIRDEDKDYLLS